MTERSTARRLLLGAATGLALAVSGVAVPIVAGALTPAIAQTSEDMAAALDAYGHWVRLPRYGEVWTPDGVPRGWRPYEYGHWVYTDEWGWYWVSDDAEDDWGWVVYHYGRWIHDRGSWFWVPGDEWAPAWVDWRYGGDDIGWAPMPPDDLADAYEDDAEYWSFVPLRYIGEPGLRRHYVPRDRRIFILRETRIINRPVHVEGRRVWVNPGLAPGFIAGRTHVTLHAYNVRPRVFGGTAGVQGAVTIRRDQLRKKGDIRRVAPVTVQRTTTAIAPVTNVPPPKPLSKGERGQLGSHPPRAVQGTVTPTPQPQVQPQAQPQVQPKPGAAGPPPKGPATIQKNGQAPVVTPTVPPKVTTPERHEERRVVTPPPGGSGAPAPKTLERREEPRVVTPPKQPNVVHPVTPHTPPPPVVNKPAPPAAVHTPPPPPAHAPPPPAARTPQPPAVRTPPPAAVHTPPPAAKGPPPKAGEKPPEQPK